VRGLGCVCAKEFCIVYWSWENVGKEPGQPDAAGDIVVNGERYHRAGEQDELSEQVAKDRLGATWMYEDVNPHDSTKSLDVYLVPEGAQPEAGRTRTRSPEIFVVARPQYAAPQYTRSAHALGHVTWKVGIPLRVLVQLAQLASHLIDHHVTSRLRVIVLCIHHNASESPIPPGFMHVRNNFRRVR
jgi:hypothetical protein